MNAKRKKKREKEQPPRLPYRFVLPDDLLQVKAWAMTQALECAFLAIRANTPLELWQLPVQAAHIGGKLAVWCEDGLQGTNDMTLYQRTYNEAFLGHYLIARQKLLSGEIAIDRATPDTERPHFLNRYAEQLLAEMTAQ